MQITVNNMSDIWFDHDQIIKAAEFYASILLTEKRAKKIILDIDINPDIEDMASCVCEEDKKNPNEFTITIRGHEDDDDILRSLAHEMVHLKQHVKNELRTSLKLSKSGKSKTVVKWHGKTVRFTKNEDHYFDSPWEIEAFGREGSLYYRYIDSNGESDGVCTSSI